MPFFAVISQHNDKVKCVSEDNKVYWAIRQYVPDTVDEARALHQEGKLTLVKSDEPPPCPWGHGVFQYDRFGIAPKEIKSNYDTSG